MGCTVSLDIFLPYITPKTNVKVGEALDYEIGLATSDRPYCHLIKIELLDIKVNGVSDEYALFFDPACLNPGIC